VWGRVRTKTHRGGAESAEVNATGGRSGLGSREARGRGCAWALASLGPSDAVARPAGRAGFTLLEMVVATLIMGIAVVGLLAGISGAARNAARLRDYDRITQLARIRMNELLVDQQLPRNAVVQGTFDPSLTGGMQAGWAARLTMFEMPPAPTAGMLALEHVQLEIWWMAGAERRTVALESLRKTTLREVDIPPVVSP
jgi:general secretion pathway protein I